MSSMCPAARLHRVARLASTRSLHTAIQGPFQEGDHVFLRRTDSADNSGILTKPLQGDARIATHLGDIWHSHIIGRSPRDVVQSTKGKAYRLTYPTLGEYCIHTPRNVTPVYPGEANLITSLLDIHVERAGSTRGAVPPVEILEAGTGHGALTLHLARTIHAANPSPSSMGPGSELSAAQKQRRGAVLHTLDISPDHSALARQHVRGFRRGLYADHVDFHIGTVPSWIEAQRHQRGSERPFLSYVVLDMPDSHEVVAEICPWMLVDARLALFCPSVTQIVDAYKTVRLQGLPLYLDQVVELGANTSAGKQWDVRMVKPRATSPPKAVSRATNDSFFSRVWSAVAGTRPSTSAVVSDMAQWHTICRPKTGDKITVGGFLGLWRRTS